MLNSLHSDIKFTAECSDKQLPFLDVLVKKDGFKIETDIYYKPTDSKQYLLFNSYHPKYTRTGIPYWLARNVSVWHRCPRPGPSSSTRRYFAKNEVEKRAITLIIIGRFYPKSNLTIFYDYIPGYKIWIQYTKSIFFKNKYRKENIFWRWKRAITPIIMG